MPLAAKAYLGRFHLMSGNTVVDGNGDIVWVPPGRNSRSYTSVVAPFHCNGESCTSVLAPFGRLAARPILLSWSSRHRTSGVPFLSGRRFLRIDLVSTERVCVVELLLLKVLDGSRELAQLLGPRLHS